MIQLTQDRGQNDVTRSSRPTLCHKHIWKDYSCLRQREKQQPQKEKSVSWSFVHVISRTFDNHLPFSLLCVARLSDEQLQWCKMQSMHYVKSEGSHLPGRRRVDSLRTAFLLYLPCNGRHGMRDMEHGHRQPVHAAERKPQKSQDTSVTQVLSDEWQVDKWLWSASSGFASYKRTVS